MIEMSLKHLTMKIPYAWLTFACWLLLTNLTQGGDMLKVGWAKADITPISQCCPGTSRQILGGREKIRFSTAMAMDPARGTAAASRLLHGSCESLFDSRVLRIAVLEKSCRACS